jgi:phosphate transport system substrate-binding protein
MNLNKMNLITGFGKKGALCAAVIFGLSIPPATANAGVVTLESNDGSVNISGEFIEYKDGNYVVRTDLGNLNFSASRVRCVGVDCPVFDTVKADVNFIGSYTVGLGIMPLLLEGYAAYLNAEIEIENTGADDEIITKFIGDGGFGDEIGTYLVRSTPTSLGFTDFPSTENAVAMGSRRIKPKEVRALRDAGLGNMVDIDQEHVIAFDSLVIIVNQDNPLASISIPDLQAIYSGAITNWKQLGGEDQPIKIVTHREGSGTLSTFRKQVYGKNAPPTPEGAIVGQDNSEISGIVNETPEAIGFVAYAFQRGAKPLNVISECGIVTSPDPFSVKTEEYSIGRRLYLYTESEADQKIKDIISYAISSEADGVIAKSGFIDLGITSREQSMESNRATALLNADVDAFEGNAIREMLAEMINSERLSTTFRFRPGSSKLDELGVLAMGRLINYLKDQPEGSTVTLVGFTDSVGPFAANRNLSVKRAQQVLDYLQETAGDQVSQINFSATGYGEISPSACNNSGSGRGINRRVEVWISR